MLRNVKGMLTSLCAVSVMAFAGPSIAQDMGFYVGASLGQSSVDVDCTGATTCDDKDTSWKIFGGYQFNRNLAVEVGYIDLGEVRAVGPTPPFGTTDVRVESTAFELVAVGSLPLAERFSLYGKAGLYRADTDINVTNTALGAASDSDSNTDLTFGIGARFDITRNLGVRAEWQRYLGVSAGALDDEFDVDVISLGVLFRF